MIGAGKWTEGKQKDMGKRRPEREKEKKACRFPWIAKETDLNMLICIIVATSLTCCGFTKKFATYTFYLSSYFATYYPEYFIGTHF